MNQDPLFDVSDKVVAVTGAAGVIYSHVARELAKRGAKVALLDIAREEPGNPESSLVAETTAKEIRASNGRAIALYCDVLDHESVGGALTKTVEALGNVDVLINGAGGNKKEACVSPDGKFLDLDLTAVDAVFELNYKGTFIPSKIFCQHFAANGHGVIINTSSMCACAPLTDVPGYSGAKAAVSNLTGWLANQVRVDLPDADIRVNEIRPGFLVTNQNRHLLYSDDVLTDRGKSIIHNTPLGRFGKPEELVGVIIMLMAEAGSFLHGTAINIDGGFANYAGVGPLNAKRHLFAKQADAK